MDITGRIAEELGIRSEQAAAAIRLIDDGNTVPFIARYRKEMTGSLDDEVLRELSELLKTFRSVEERREEVARLITEQEKMTDEIMAALRCAGTVSEIDDIYLPFRPKKKTRASAAREKGLEPLAESIFSQKETVGSLKKLAEAYISNELGVSSAEEALSGAGDIVAEKISEMADLRKYIRDNTYSTGFLTSSSKKEEDTVYGMYYDYREKLSSIPSHRILAVTRGEKENILSVKVETDEDVILEGLGKKLIRTKEPEVSLFIKNAIKDSYKRLIAPSVEREIRNELWEKASRQSLKIFSLNLKNLLMQPPLKGKVIMGLDPAYRTGCKIAVIDETGKLLDTAVIYPTPPQNKTEEAEKIITGLIERHGVQVISIGNGTASKESEIFIASLIKKEQLGISYAVVNEAGASVYSASKLGAEEFPELDVSLRSAVSIARRLSDPLAELVKIEPKSIGVGQYQHDIKQSLLTEGLDGVVEDCVNSVGVDINTASWPLLAHLAGINNTLAKNIVKYREKNGKLKSKRELLMVGKLGEKAFQQCAGFIRVPDCDDVLDNTGVHPESYEAAHNLIKLAGAKDTGLQKALERLLAERSFAELAQTLNIGVPTLKDIIDELKKPGRDIRESLPEMELRSELLDINDLKEGMTIKGKVTNVVDFGAFVDIGVHQDGLVHISQISDKYVKHPSDILKTGDFVTVKVLDVDIKKRRISLSMKF